MSDGNDDRTGHDRAACDETPALGKRGGPAPWRRAVPGGVVALARPAWGDASWSYLYRDDTSYAGPEPEEGEIAAANLRMRSGAMPQSVEGPVIHPPVWTWEVPLYFWFGGMASGAAFCALAADLAGDEWTAAVARKVAMGAVLPAPVLLIADLGRPGRFLNMLRIFKPRSPMNLGAWCLTAFSATGVGAVGADLIGWRRTAKGLGGAQAVLGSYLGSYAGVLLATTAVPLWARSRAFLGPIFVATATATGAAATRLTLAAVGQAQDEPSQAALAHLEAAAILAELTLSTVNERRRPMPQRRAIGGNTSPAATSVFATRNSAPGIPCDRTSPARPSDRPRPRRACCIWRAVWHSGSPGYRPGRPRPATTRPCADGAGNGDDRRAATR